MLGIVIAAALSPNFGTVSAQTSTPYSQPTSSSGLSPYVYLGIAAVIIIAALIVALAILSRRRRQPPAAGAAGAAAGVQPWDEGGGPPPGAGGAAPPAPPSAAPAYLETPEDVGAPTPVPTMGAGAAAGAAAGAGAAEGEPDIDSLMAELDKISGEILKRAPKKSDPTSDASASDTTKNP